MHKPKDDLTFDEVNSRYLYDPVSGILYSKIGNRRRGIPDPLNPTLRPLTCKDGGGYLVVNIKQSYYKIHRIAWLLHYGEWPSREIDHIDGNIQNNAISNLRIASHAQNSKNRKLNHNATSGYKGVSWYPKNNKWRATICVDKKWRFIGYFTEKANAISARLEAEKEAFGEFSRLPLRRLQ